MRVRSSRWHLAASVTYGRGGFYEPKFYGGEVRGLRRRHAWLRRRLGERKLLPVMRRIGRRERRRVNAVLHHISKAVVEAKAVEAAILLGDLKGIRERARGRRLNRIVASMLYYRLTQMVVYKAAWEGISVYVVSERGTSKTCHRCRNEGKRPTRGLFLCPSCGLEYNADLNAALNLAKRFEGYTLSNGAALDTAHNSGQ